eukprot:CAMPEP_0117854130 /NCGR_PEP_ID=MMETSP0949-20121206/24144_1 /TAXON_ID=44440 /ORGANISM="Chattonella subsalsa, Strain CCMP2191" /LENGTH=144 /DNA_ID=CAMNT_0005702745 /DNA_START=74 /DNA_END=508 /DNA_ORIENTATION=+
MKIQAYALSALCQLADNYAVRRYLQTEQEIWLNLLKKAVSQLKKIHKSKVEIDPETEELFTVEYDEPSEYSVKVAEYACKLIAVVGYDERMRMQLAETAVEPVLYCMEFCDWFRPMVVLQFTICAIETKKHKEKSQKLMKQAIW